MSLEARVARIEAHIEHIDEDMRSMKQDISGIRSELLLMNSDFNSKLMEMGAKLNAQMWSNFKWLLSIFIAGFGTLTTLMAHGFHWL